MSISRFNAVEKASNRKAVEAITPNQKVSEYYGENVFNRKAMQKYLSKETYKALTHAIDNGTPIDREIANHVAAGMRMWALEKGVTHYTHWFQPLTDGTAEKHDAFVEHDGGGGMIEEFSGKLLAQQEPDASSFPNGGLRNTFEARGYSAWDPSSPAFIVDDTLCIPTVFIAYTGEALDYKTPLIRSIEALNKAAKEVCNYFNEEVGKVITYLGWEQEYFLVDEDLYSARPDLSLTERTLLGHESAKNQQLDDHYFGAIPSRVQEFMKDLETECYKLGIPVKTRHNEVAPNQFELAPIYEECNLANDHNQLLMSVMKRVSRRHNFRVLLHEKPFMGVNGSGKHCNWSMGTDTGINLFSPGKDREDNLRFITFVVNSLMAVYKYNALLKASIASATNAHRLGANEAPPAIISSFLGTQITEILDKFENCSIEDAIEVDDKKRLHLGFGQIPELLLDNTDRNRSFCFHRKPFRIPRIGIIGQLWLGYVGIELGRCLPAPPVQTRCRGIARQREEQGSRHLRSAESLHQRIQTDPLRRKRLRRRMERRGCPPRSGLREQRSVTIRCLPETGSHPDVQGNRCTERKGAGSPQRSEMGNLYKKGTDRSPRPGRPLAQPYHPGCRPLPVVVAGQHRQVERDIRRISGI